MYVFWIAFDEVVINIFWTTMIQWNCWVSLISYWWWIILTKLIGIGCLYLRL